MRIGLISREYPPETGWGGIGTYAHRIAHALAALGHEVHVVSRSDQPEEYVRMDGAVTVHRILEKKLRFPGIDFLYHAVPLSEWYYSKRVRAKILELHGKQAFDIVEVPEYRAEGLHLVQDAPMPVAVKLHTPSYILNEAALRPWSLREFLADKLERRLTFRSRAVSSPSDDLLKRVKADWGLPLHRLEVVPNPADPVLSNPEPWPGDSATPTFLFVGRINRMKGIDILGEAVVGVLESVPSARFILVGVPGDTSVLGGDVELFSRLKERWGQAGILGRIELVPWQRDASKVRDYYRKCHIVVVPSRYDNFPNVLLEAMAAGRAVVGSAIGGIAEVVKPNISGLLVPPADVEALRDALTGLLRDLPKARQFGINGQKIIAQRLSTPFVAAQTIEWYAGVIESWKKRQEGAKVLAISTERWVDWQKDEGVAIVVPEFLAGMERQGMDVRFIRRPYQPKRARAWGHQGLTGHVMGIWDIAADIAHVPGDVAFVLWHWLRQPSQFDLIWERHSLFGVSGAFLSLITGRRLVLNLDAPPIEELEKLQKVYFGAVRRAVAHWALRLNLRLAVAIHVPSGILADWMASEYRVPRDKFHVVPNGVHGNAYSKNIQPELARRRYGIGSEPTVLFIGSLQPWHGCEVLIQAFAKVRQQCPEARLVIAGEGKTRVALVNQAQTLSLNGAAHFVGQVPHRQVPELLALADIVVLPYPKLPVPFYFSPIKLFEYMAAGKAIIASRSGQIAEILRDAYTARLVEPGSVDELAQVLVEVIQSPDRGAALGLHARALSSQYAWKHQGNAVAELCFNALKAGRR